jgi:hypothetical protein
MCVAGKAELRIDLSQIVAAEMCIGMHPARKKAAAYGAVGQRGQTMPSAIGQDVLLGFALEEIVRRLRRVERSDPSE